MCQLNLVFVKNLKNKEILKNNEYNSFGDDFNNFSPYLKGFCNCGSFVGSMCEYDGNSYSEMLEFLNKPELDNLYKIKDFMKQPNYKDLREKYITERDALSNALDKFFEPISNYEMEQINILEKKYSGQELQKQMEKLYSDLDEKFRNIENSSEFRTADLKLKNFIAFNKLMDESTFYYLTKEEEDKDNKLIPADVFLSHLEKTDAENANVEYITLPEEESFVIDYAIKNLKNKYQKDYDIFLEYKNLFENLLENEEYILFCCVWEAPENLAIEKEVNIKDLKIEDLASLDYNKILKICK